MDMKESVSAEDISITAMYGKKTNKKKDQLPAHINFDSDGPSLHKTSISGPKLLKAFRWIPAMLRAPSCP
jgi:hypothetical protein